MITIDVSAGVNVSAGLGRYTRSLVTAMLPYAQPHLFYNQIDGRTQLPSEFIGLPARSVKLGYKPWRMGVLVGHVAGIGMNRLVPEATVFHAAEHLLMPLGGVKTVMTVHDLIFKLFPEHHKRLNYWYLNLAMPRYVAAADAIIAISEATKRDLIEHYGTPAEKIHVIYEAANSEFVPQAPDAIERVRQKFELPRKFVLSVGTIEPRKNYQRLLKALVAVRKDQPDLYWVIVGSKGWLYEPFLAELEALGATEWVIFPGFVPDDDLPALYGAASLYVMASVYEGFGLPVLEAMASGTPVLSSNAASLPELGGDAIGYFDPQNIEEMTVSILNMLRADSLRQENAERGLQQAARFSWDKAAQETLALYESLLR